MMISRPVKSIVVQEEWNEYWLRKGLQTVRRDGAQIQEIFEAIFQVAAYAGFAAAWDALEKLAEVLNENPV